MIHVYTGNGKGKTTSALGIIIRALGHKWKICLIQFLKGDWKYGELKILKKLSGIDIYKFGTLELIDPSSPSEIDYQEAYSGWEKAVEIIRSKKYQLIVLDEINVAVYMKLLPVERQLELMKMAEDIELVMTGRYADKKVIKEADIVTEMQLVKHYYDRGIKSRKGIEF